MNANESRDQWTDVWGIPATPTSTASLPAGTSVENYDSGGQTVVRVYRVSGMGHGTPVDPDTYDALRRSFDPGVAEFLGLEYVKPNTLGNTRMLRTL